MFVFNFYAYAIKHTVKIQAIQAEALGIKLAPRSYTTAPIICLCRGGSSQKLIQAQAQTALLSEDKVDCQGN